MVEDTGTCHECLTRFLTVWIIVSLSILTPNVEKEGVALLARALEIIPTTLFRLGKQHVPVTA